ncbi:MAG TPA: protein phosphatase 2C domain-containing protein, partial [Chloroflexaceae bacterium]|nr:protein phosphatase 2C domain-containing protein [Chloroflexaceae bacterium]
GGHRGGAYASSMAVRQIVHHLGGATPGDAGALGEALRRASRDIAQLGQQDAALAQMGSTAVLAVTAGDVAHIANVGDSRAYLWRSGALTQLSTDDRWVEEQIRLHGMSREQGRNHTLRNVLTQHLGSDREIEPHLVAPLRLLPGDRLLLCTDGLFEAVDELAIAATLAGPPARAARRLVRQAIAARTGDNVTVVVGYYGPEPARGLGLLYALLGLIVLAAALLMGFALVRPGSAPAAGLAPSVVQASATAVSVVATSTVAPTSTTQPVTPAPTSTVAPSTPTSGQAEAATSSPALPEASTPEPAPAVEQAGQAGEVQPAAGPRLTIDEVGEGDARLAEYGLLAEYRDCASNGELVTFLLVRTGPLGVGVDFVIIGEDGSSSGPIGIAPGTPIRITGCVSFPNPVAIEVVGFGIRATHSFTPGAAYLVIFDPGPPHQTPQPG